jgi:hypothetical protein
VRSTAMVNHYYFYGFDDDFGPFFIKFCSNSVRHKICALFSEPDLVVKRQKTGASR